MKGITTNVTRLRRAVFREIARFAYEEKDYRKIDELPAKLLSGSEELYRGNKYLEIDILSQRLRLAMGLSLNEDNRCDSISKDIERAVVGEKYYNLPLINVIKYACNACSEKRYFVTNICSGCVARPCQEVCPKDAIHFDENRKSKIDSSKCVKCGRCANVCPYGAIVKQERPCAAACGVDAISSDEFGKAAINPEKCVSCGACMASCPYGAIADKSQIFQLIKAIKDGAKVVAAIAPAFVGQFGEDISAEQLKAAFKELGFSDVVEVAIGADLCSFGEAQEFIHKVPSSQPFMATSCCPAWSVMAKRNFTDLAEYISMELTPMVFTGRLIKNKNPDVKVAFIGPCTAKKLEALRKSVRSDIDFVLTFEEVIGMFEAKGVDIKNKAPDCGFEKASADGRNFAISNGVANAVAACAKKLTGKDIPIDSAQGLKNCKTMLLMARAGKRQGYLLEGMACVGGCVGGPGTVKEINKATKCVNSFSKLAKKEHAFESEYVGLLKELIDEK